MDKLAKATRKWGGGDLTTSFLALIASVLAAALPLFGAEPILLKAGTIHPEGEDKVQTLKATPFSTQAEGVADRGLYIIQHDGIITPDWRGQIEKAGAIIRGYIPENAYLIEASSVVYETMRMTVPNTYFGEYRSEYRYDATAIASIDSADKSGSGASSISAQTKEFTVRLFEDDSRDEIASRIEKLSECSVSSAGGKIIRAILTAVAVREIASWVDVSWVEPYEQLTVDNDVAVESARMNVKTVWPDGSSNLGLTGEGQIVGVADSGFDTGDESTMHRDVQGRMVKGIGVAVSGDWSDLNGHGTHVVGSVLGDGAASDGKIKGVAYRAKLVMQSMGKDSSGELYLPSGGTSELYSQAYEYGARIHSNSWGGGSDNSYTGGAYDTDDFMFTHPDMLILRSAGNGGVDVSPTNGVVDLESVSSYAVSKNAIVVGASENYRTTGNYASSSVLWGSWWHEDYPATPISTDHLVKPCIGGIQGMAAFSSRGPCSDGRIKPDIVAPGTGILSLLSSRAKAPSDDSEHFYNGSYQYMQGTSQATPLVAGSAALVRQWLAENRKIANPDGATIKAVLLAGAKSLTPGQYGTGEYREIPESYPNNVEGWGQVDLGNSLQNENGLLVYDAQVIAVNETKTFKVKATAGNQLNVVMAYADAPASLSAAKQLVNDLDLLVTSPSGTKYYPNSRTSADRINNVEGVRIPSGSVKTGVYTITVKGYNIAQGMSSSLTGGKSNAQRYSLVVNGADELAPTFDIENGVLTSVQLNDCTSVAIPDTVTTIGWKAFSGCSAMISVSIPESVTRIEDSAFIGCVNLKSVVIPSSVTDIGECPFSGCSKLESISVGGGNQHFNVSSGALFDISAKTLVQYELGRAGTCSIPDGIGKIGVSAFAGASRLTSIIMPDSVRHISSKAFDGCTGLSEISVSAGMTQIDNNAFNNCSGLTRITFNDNSPTMGANVFNGVPGTCFAYVPASSTGWGVSIPGIWNGLKIRYQGQVVSYSIAFSANGGTGGKTFADVGEGRTLGYYMKQVSPVRSGYIFNGWWTAKSGGTKVTETTTVTDNATYYAHWVLPKYTVQFHANGGTGGKTFTITKGSSLGDYMNQLSPVREGYAFNGWWTEKSGGTKVAETTTVTADATYYAHWVVLKYTVLFHANGGTGGKTFTIARGSLLGDYMKLVSPVRSGYVFNGWWTEKSGGGGIRVDETTEVTENATYYAHWTVPKYTVLFHANGGTGGKAFTIAKGSSLGSYMNQLSPMREGYTFDGWWTAKSGGTKVTETTTVTGAATNYVHWIANTYEVTLDRQAGSGGTANVTVTYGSEMPAIAVPTRSNYFFGGYFAAPDGRGYQYYTASGTSARTWDRTSSTTLYAKWTHVPTFTVNDGVLSGVKLYEATDFVIPDGVTSIGDSAFSECTYLTSVTIPNSVTNIGISAFYDCTSLTNVSIPNKVTNIGESAFKFCSGLVRVSIPNGVMNIGNETFCYCTGLTSVTIPNSVTNIGESAFRNCSGLTNVMIPDSVTSIGQYAFSGCSDSIFDTTTNPGVISVSGWVVGYGSLYGNLDLTSVRGIADYAFYNCSGLTRVTVPDSVIGIGQYAFYRCSGLMSVTIGKGVVSIGTCAFCDCNALTSVYITDLAKWCCISFGDSSANPLCSAKNLYLNGEKLEESLVIPDGVTSIGIGAFCGCSGLTHVTIPDSVTNIGHGAFAGCSGLTEITLPFVGSQRGNSGSPSSVFGYIFGTSSYDGGTEVCQYYASGYYAYCYIPTALESVTVTDETIFGYGAFYGCPGLARVTIPNSVTNIGSYAFYNCSGLTSVTILDSVTSIGYGAFAGCGGLAEITLPFVGSQRGNSGSPSSVFGYIFGTSSYAGGTRTCQYHSSYYYDYYYIPTALKSVTVTDETIFGYGAFYGCRGFTHVAIPNGVMSIENDAFYYCTNLTSVTIPNSVTNIGESAFYSCSDSIFDTTTIPGVKLVDGWVIGYSGSISGNLDLTSVRGIRAGAFAGCSGLTGVTIGKGATGIGAYAFRNCSGLMSVTMPRRFEGCLGDAFSGCPSNMQITYYDPTYAITFNANGGTGGKKFPDVGDGRTLGYYMNQLTPARSGYIFDGWWTAANGGTKVDATTTVDSDATYYAHWALPTYTITFHANGGTGGKAFTMEKGTKLSDYMNKVTPKYDGHTFNGWWTERTGGSWVSPSTVATGSKTYYAHWTALTFTVGGSVPWSQQYDGIWKSGAIKDAQTSWLKATVSGAGSLTFKWKVSSEQDYDILAFYVDGVAQANISGTGVTEWREVCVTVTGSGSHTLQWKYAKDGDNKAGGDCGWVKDIDWEGSVYSITFNANGGTGGKKFPSVGLGRTLGYYMKQLSPKRDGYDFNGWWTKPTDGEQVDVSTVVTGDATYYAHWKIPTCTVVFHANGGTGGKTFTVAKGKALGSILPAPKRAGYIFAGWYTSKTGGTKVSSSMVVTEDVTYYAHWTEMGLDGNSVNAAGAANCIREAPAADEYLGLAYDMVGEAAEMRLFVFDDGEALAIVEGVIYQGELPLLAAPDGTVLMVVIEGDTMFGFLQ